MSGWTRGHRPGQSSLSSLAHPLSPPLTLRLQSGFLLAGLSDSVQYRKAVESIQLDPVIQSAVTKCTLLQAFILVCVTGVDWLLLPAWTRGTASNGSGSGRQRMTEEQARFYFQVRALVDLCNPRRFIVSVPDTRNNRSSGCTLSSASPSSCQAHSSATSLPGRAAPTYPWYPAK